uniref:Uncharacterized protein n=1 Tax=Hemiselmis andersenii TaxID=464988 RepID=A0A6U4SH18_HEMAN|mmetsp:Transcript_33116/g.77526  ORF Transcript_33116/g.77526 Transcript_33116/m.77526 type:complete len:190 (-) Transcript_33116:838-1407(-)
MSVAPEPQGQGGGTFHGRVVVDFFDESKGFQTGHPVMLKGLVTASHLNGSQGSIAEVKAPAEGGETIFVVDLNGEQVFVKLSNLKMGVECTHIEGHHTAGEVMQLSVKCAKDCDLEAFQSAVTRMLKDPSQPNAEYSIKSLQYDDQNLQSTAPFKWVAPGSEVLLEGNITYPEKPPEPSKQSSGCCAVS